MKSKLLFFTICFLALSVTKAQIITTVAGNGAQGFSGDGGLATNAKLNDPYGITIDATGNIYIVDTDNSRIRKVATSGIITTIAGTSTAGFSGDGGQATNAELSRPWGIAFDVANNLYIADYGNNRVRKVNTLGIITTVAGKGTFNYSGDGGQATAAGLNTVGVVLDTLGNLYIVDNNRIRKVNTLGIITTVAGNGASGYIGDGGQATAAELNSPLAVALDAGGNLYISDELNNCIRKVNTNGIINTIAGNGNSGYFGDGGQATAASLSAPIGLTLDAFGNLFIADTYNSVIRKVDAFGIITTVAGNNLQGFSGDGGQATAASISNPFGVAFDATGNLYFSDEGNMRIRKVTNVAQAGIKKLTLNNEQLTIYPNPANNKVYVEAKEIIEVKLFDLLGKEIISAKEKEIDVSNLNEGVYFIQVKSKENIYTQKIIVQH
jgi:hypothetical protein